MTGALTPPVGTRPEPMCLPYSESGQRPTGKDDPGCKTGQDPQVTLPGLTIVAAQQSQGHLQRHHETTLRKRLNQRSPEKLLGADATAVDG